jgi:NADH-quinone oxidoreductase subunit C
MTDQSNDAAPAPLSKLAALAAELHGTFGDRLKPIDGLADELAYEVAPSDLLEIAATLRDDPRFAFEAAIDVSGIDYLTYGREEWDTHDATRTGFGRGVTGRGAVFVPPEPMARRFAVAYHLLSYANNQRLRLRCYCDTAEPPTVPSVVGIWPAANWFEREAFDLYGILFQGHPDLRRILTDYGFIGHPFRKDFPLSGHVEVRYDSEQGRVVYEPVSIEPRVAVPRVIRDDNRYDTALSPSRSGK